MNHVVTPPPERVIDTILERLDRLQKVGVLVDGDIAIDSNDAAAITGLAPRTVRKYGQNGYISTVKYDKRLLFSCRDCCLYMKRKYRPAVISNTTKMTNYKPVKKGRPAGGRR
ncbi:hypothetical protein FACS189447_01720 [Spirochaetia bacterium]|nr:hypothetical protein FACS189447_01720 [Spirochaetia bacterium]